MQIEKVIRLVAVFFVVAAFAVHIATRLMFPESSAASDRPLSIGLLICLAAIWNDTRTDKKITNSK